MYPIVEVTWLDAWSSSGDYYKGGDHAGLESKTIGYLMEYTDVSIVLIMSYAVEGNGGRPTFCIPVEYIVSVEELVS